MSNKEIFDINNGNRNNNSGNNIRSLVFAAVCLALCMILPFITGQVQWIAQRISPMHIPVFLAGFLCGPWWAMAVGFVAPILRSLIFGMPPMIPTGVAMAFELAAYGFFTGILSKLLPKTTSSIYISLVGAMLLGRIVWGLATWCILGLTGGEFTFSAFMAGAFVNAIPAIVVHIVLIPLIVMALKKARLLHYQ